MKLTCYFIITLGNPGSSLEKHVNGRKPSIQHNLSTNEDSDNDIYITNQLRISFKTNVFINSQQQIRIMLEQRYKFYTENVMLTEDEAILMCKQTQLQNTELWLFERKKRITASKCYDLYTYSRNKNPDWPLKISKILTPSRIKLKNCEYGIKTEAEARKWYENCVEKTVTQLGFVVHPNAPFLGCSPDGCCFSDGTLIEIKCSIDGATKPLPTVLPNLKYLYCAEGVGYSLKKKHAYYGQIQLNMLLLGLGQCDLIVYGEFSKCGYIIKIYFDKVFAEDLYEKLHYIYFTHYLPILSDT